MLSPSVFTASPLAIRSLWPDSRPLFYHMEQEMIRHLREMRHSMEYMERLHQKIFDELDQTSSSKGIFTPIAFQDLGRDGGFAISLDTKEFSPEELSVKQVGRKLRVSGRAEKEQEGEKGSYSYRCQEFRQEFDLPDAVDPQTITCSLVGGQLRIQAPRERDHGDGKERVVPIRVASVAAITSSQEGSGPSVSGDGPSESDPAHDH